MKVISVDNSDEFPFRIAIIGYGLIGRRRADAILRLKDHLPVDLSIVVDPTMPQTDSSSEFKGLMHV